MSSGDAPIEATHRSRKSILSGRVSLYLASSTLLLTFGILAKPFAVSIATSYLIYVPMALGLCLLWGYGGVLSFGQTAFFGLSGYTYAVAATNFGPGLVETWCAVGIALVATGIASATLGYFIFYGRISDVFVGILTLSTTLVLETFLAQTSGREWHVGKAYLNGYNGMTGMPVIELPWLNVNVLLQDRPLYFASLLVIVAAARPMMSLRATRFGRVLIAVRDNDGRAEALGYDTAAIRIVAFVLASVLAAVSGILYVNWGEYITPSAMSLTAAAAPVIWVSVGGRTSVPGVAIATVALLFISQQLAIYGDQWALILLGSTAIASTLIDRDRLSAKIDRWIARSGASRE